MSQVASRGTSKSDLLEWIKANPSVHDKVRPELLDNDPKEMMEVINELFTHPKIRCECNSKACVAMCNKEVSEEPNPVYARYEQDYLSGKIDPATAIIPKEKVSIRKKNFKRKYFTCGKKLRSMMTKGRCPERDCRSPGCLDHKCDYFKW